MKQIYKINELKKILNKNFSIYFYSQVKNNIFCINNEKFKITYTQKK